MALPGNWAFTGQLATARFAELRENAVVLDDGRVLLAGGSGDGQLNALATAELFDNGTWSSAGSMNTHRRISSITKLKNGSVLVAGGFTSPPLFAATDSAEVYNPVTNSWELTGSMHSPRAGHSATPLTDGRVLVAGGLAPRSVRHLQSLSSAELYDPATGTWEQTGAMLDARAGHPAVMLGNGLVLVAGGGITVGFGIDIGLSYCELYDPSAGTWMPTGSMMRNREGHEATLLVDGTVLVTGGIVGEGDPPTTIDDRSIPAAELYDPGPGEWTAVPEMLASRAWHRAVLLPSGQVLVAGGANPDDDPQVGLFDAEIYDPTSKTWSPASKMAVGRFFFSAVQLSVGQVLVAGGIVEAGEAGSTISETAELFSP